jgi:hypothetical protein
VITVVFKKHITAKCLENQKEEERKIPADKNKNVTHTSLGLFFGFNWSLDQ